MNKKEKENVLVSLLAWFLRNETDKAKRKKIDLTYLNMLSLRDFARSFLKKRKYAKKVKEILECEQKK